MVHIDRTLVVFINIIQGVRAFSNQGLGYPNTFMSDCKKCEFKNYVTKYPGWCLPHAAFPYV